MPIWNEEYLFRPDGSIAQAIAKAKKEYPMTPTQSPTPASQATVTALDSLKREALEIFDGTETSQDVRDVIEWYSASIRVILDKARSRINAALSAPAAAAEPSGPSDNREAVARAICVACEEHPDHEGDARGNDFRWQDYLGAADAAIAACAQPSAVIATTRASAGEAQS